MVLAVPRNCGKQLWVPWRVGVAEEEARGRGLTAVAEMSLGPQGIEARSSRCTSF